MRPRRRPRPPSRSGSPGPRSPGRPAPRRRGGTAGCGARPDLRAVPETARVAEVTAGRAARCPPAVAQDGQLAHLDAHVPFLRAALLYNRSWQPRPLLAVTLLFLLRAGAADLDRALVGVPAVVVLVVVVHAGSFEEPG